MREDKVISGVEQKMMLKKRHSLARVNLTESYGLNPIINREKMTRLR